ncbi:MAG: DNA polymerase III subunit gamma/tau [Candidatus Sumerlaeia bacterium]
MPRKSSSKKNQVNADSENTAAPSADRTASPRSVASGPAAARKPYQTFALKWRPQTFREVVGQPTVVNSLRHALEQGRIANAYLFCGPRGTGKTSTARILAKALNCTQGITSEPCGECDSCQAITAGIHLDVIEIDGASYTRTEQIQEFLEGINRHPFSARFKVYIIDEVHMLSAAAFNRLLKTLEEPPEFVVFILATTNPEKIPATIVSRCQVQEFSAISSREIRERLAWIADQEGIALDPSTRDVILDTLAHHAEGGLRDASVALDQLINLCDGQLTLDAARQMLGLVDRDLLFQTLDSLQAGDTTALMDVIERLARKGRSLERFTADLLGLVRDALLFKSTRNTAHLEEHYTTDRIQWFSDRLEKWDYAFLLNTANQLLWVQEKMRSSANPRFLIELAFLKLTAMNKALSLDQLTRRLQQIPAAPITPSGVNAAGDKPESPPADTRQSSSPAGAHPPAKPDTQQPSPGQTSLFNQKETLALLGGLGAPATEAPRLFDVLREGATASGVHHRQAQQSAADPSVHESPPAAGPARSVQEINLPDLWAQARRRWSENAPFLNNHLDDVCPLALEGRRLILGIVENQHTQYNLNFLKSSSKTSQLRETLSELLGFEINITWKVFVENSSNTQAPTSNITASVTEPLPAGDDASDASTPKGVCPPSPSLSSAHNEGRRMEEQAPGVGANHMMDTTLDDVDLHENADSEEDSDGSIQIEADRKETTPRTLEEAFARYPHFKTAVQTLQKLVEGEIIHFDPA